MRKYESILSASPRSDLKVKVVVLTRGRMLSMQSHLMFETTSRHFLENVVLRIHVGLTHTSRAPPFPKITSRWGPDIQWRCSIKGLPPPHELVAAVELHFDGTSYLQGTHGWPHTSLTMENPIFNASLGRSFQKLPEITGAEVRDKGQVGPRNGFIDEQPPD